MLCRRVLAKPPVRAGSPGVRGYQRRHVAHLPPRHRARNRRLAARAFGGEKCAELTMHDDALGVHLSSFSERPGIYYYGGP